MANVNLHQHRPEGWPLTCSVLGCENPTRTKSAELCKKHYHRQYRHGSVEKTAWGTEIGSHVRKYRRVYRPDCPIAWRNGLVYEHRFVLFEKVGPEDQLCHWCGRSIVWVVPGPRRNDIRLIYVDHLNRITHDNRPENVVPACHPCNSRRGQLQRHEALVEQGWWSSHDTREALRG